MLRDEERENDRKERGESKQEEKRLKAGQNLKDAHNKTKSRVRVRAIFMKSIRPPPLNGDNKHRTMASSSLMSSVKAMLKSKS